MRRSALHLASVFVVLLGLSPSLETGSVRAAPPRPAAQQSSAPQKAKPTPTPKSRPASQTPGRRPKPQPRATPPPARPDRSLFESAQRAEGALRASRQKLAKRSEWERVASAYRNVVDRYPRSPYCDDALLKAGDMQREMADRFANRRYSDQALESYALIVEEYPGSRLGGPALFATYEILLARAQKPGARAAAEKYLAAYPDGAKARALKQALAESIPVPATRGAGKTEALPAPSGGSQFERSEGSGGGQVQVFGVRFWSGESSTRVVIDLDRKVEIKQDRLQSPPRLFVDLIGTRLHPNLVGKTFPVGNAFLKQIRIGVNRQNVVRVVIDFGEASSHSVFFLADPERLVIDVRGEAAKNLRTAASDVRPSGLPDRVNATPPQEVMERVEITQRMPVNPESTPEPVAQRDSPPPAPAPALPGKEDAGASGAEPQVTPASSRPTPSPSALPAPASTPPIPEAPPRPPALSPSPANTGAAPTKNRDGTYSLARQLGLGARRICLDAGHGGHDPGAIGRGGTQEKDVTLAVVLKLEKLIRSELGADVVLTRDTDVFIPLEERTAIANASGADLFLSVHINSARSSAGRGLETYYLSFAKSAAAEELAARENAISQATMKDLNNLVKAIATNSKIEESRDFAGIVQRGNIEGLSPDFRGVLDRGVHTAPFYVLIGANMPSILTEVGFISNPDEERWLKSDEYQSKLALSLLEGVRSYLGQLNRNQATRMGGRSGVRVAAKGRSNR